MSAVKLRSARAGLSMIFVFTLVATGLWSSAADAQSQRANTASEVRLERVPDQVRSRLKQASGSEPLAVIVLGAPKGSSVKTYLGNNARNVRQEKVAESDVTSILTALGYNASQISNITEFSVAVSSNNCAYHWVKTAGGWTRVRVCN